MQPKSTLLLLLLSLLLLFSPLRAAVLRPELSEASNALSLAAQEIGYLELKPNGTLILRRVPDEVGGNLQNLLLLRGILQALKLQPRQEQGKLDIKMYGDGVEHKFPPLLENIIQRIQTFFSIYRYTDTSRPVRKDELSTTQLPQAVASTQRAAETPTTTTLAQPEAEMQTEKEPGWITVGEDE